MNFNSLPPDCPPSLKSINPFLQRAREIQRIDPVISYWCAFHAAQTCMSIGHQEPLSREFLIKLVDSLELARTQLAENDAITNNLAATAYVENFALKIFDQADRDDRLGLSNRSTAQRFLAAACFLQVLESLTNQLEPDISQRIKYAKWKAASISKALRDQHPSRPNQANDPNHHHPPSISTDSIREPQNGWLDPSQLTPTSAALTGDPSNDWPKDLHATKSLPSPIPRSQPSNLLGSSSSSSSSSSHQHHLNPFPSTVFPPSIHHPSPAIIPAPSDLTPIAPSSPPALSHDLNPISPPNPSHPSGSSFQQQPLRSEPPIEHQTLYSTPSNLHPTTTTTTTTTINPKNHLSTSDVYGSMITTHPGSLAIDPSKVSKAQKHAKWAISALNFDDILTAKNELQIALDTLNSL